MSDREMESRLFLNLLILFLHLPIHLSQLTARVKCLSEKFIPKIYYREKKLFSGITFTY